MGEVRPDLGMAARDYDLRGRRNEVAHHEAEIAAHETFNYAVSTRERPSMGCATSIRPTSSPAGTDAVASWWVVDRGGRRIS